MLCACFYFSTFRFARNNHISFCKSSTFRFAGLRFSKIFAMGSKFSFCTKEARKAS
uniref:Uncharacterized protein n=1 Tax=Myoviridae sp. ctLEM34 TaxID=2825082 RepID=A0A8S5TQZ6_9CAUD|nr:MAG TPA: hypothetical protein [Myoviridae sp. ctLEM34]